MRAEMTADRRGKNNVVQTPCNVTEEEQEDDDVLAYAFRIICSFSDAFNHAT